MLILFERLHKLMLDVLKVYVHVLVLQFNVVLAEGLFKHGREFRGAGGAGE